MFSRKHAMTFIVLLGLVSLFADMTYEGARSVTGAYLAVLGASGAIVGFVAGFGELVGYGFRVVSGYLADKTKSYWPITITGYTINMLAVPALALTHHWPMAAVLIVMERFGKAIRTPSRDAMLSHAGEQVGMGWGFGLHEAMDQTGAMLGPLTVAIVLYLHGSYQHGFAVLLIPALIALTLLGVAFKQFPHPEHLSVSVVEIENKNFKLNFWIYVIAAAFIAAGFADFPLIAYHFQKSHILTAAWIPIAYGMAMGLDGLMSPILGKLFDQKGIIVLIIVTFLTAFFAPLAFLGNAQFAFLGVALWAVGIGAQGSLMRAIVGNMISKDKRASAYGIFNLVYGVAWFAGSAFMGILYDASLIYLVLFSVLSQLIAIPFLVFLKLNFKKA